MEATALGLSASLTAQTYTVTECLCCQKHQQADTFFQISVIPTTEENMTRGEKK